MEYIWWSGWQKQHVAQRGWSSIPSRLPIIADLAQFQWLMLPQILARNPRPQSKILAAIRLCQKGCGWLFTRPALGQVVSLKNDGCIKASIQGYGHIVIMAVTTCWKFLANFRIAWAVTINQKNDCDSSVSGKHFLRSTPHHAGMCSTRSCHTWKRPTPNP